MRPFAAFLKKEFKEAFRTGRFMILTLLFLVFGVMNPAFAKLTPWLMETLSDTMAESGLIVTDIQVDAMTSWAQFFKNLPMALIAMALLCSDVFTREYQSGTLILVLTKGLSRAHLLLAKTVLLLSLWSLGYGLCFAVTYGYNAYFWDNSIARDLIPAVLFWWLFGVCILCLLILFSTLCRSSAVVTLCTGGTALLAYLLRFLPGIKAYMPSVLMGAVSLLTGDGDIREFQKAAVVSGIFCFACVAAGVRILNRRRL